MVVESCNPGSHLKIACLLSSYVDNRYLVDTAACQIKLAIFGRGYIPNNSSA
jgi:hypothetical protein